MAAQQAVSGKGGCRLDPRWPEVEREAVTVRLTIPGNPVPKGRPRLGRHGRTYTPRETVVAEARLTMLLRTSRARRPEPGKVYGLQVVFHATGRRDADNLLKTVLDAGNGEAWIDDQHVVEVLMRVERGAENPRTELLIYEAGDAVVVRRRRPAARRLAA